MFIQEILDARIARRMMAKKLSTAIAKIAIASSQAALSPQDQQTYTGLLQAVAGENPRPLNEAEQSLLERYSDA
jgi:Trp operon repressor